MIVTGTQPQVIYGLPVPQGHPVVNAPASTLPPKSIIIPGRVGPSQGTRNQSTEQSPKWIQNSTIASETPKSESLTTQSPGVEASNSELSSSELSSSELSNTASPVQQEESIEQEFAAKSHVPDTASPAAMANKPFGDLDDAAEVSQSESAEANEEEFAFPQLAAETVETETAQTEQQEEFFEDQQEQQEAGQIPAPFEALERSKETAFAATELADTVITKTKKQPARLATPVSTKKASTWWLYLAPLPLLGWWFWRMLAGRRKSFGKAVSELEQIRGNQQDPVVTPSSTEVTSTIAATEKTRPREREDQSLQIAAEKLKSASAEAATPVVAKAAASATDHKVERVPETTTTAQAVTASMQQSTPVSQIDTESLVREAMKSNPAAPAPRQAAATTPLTMRQSAATEVVPEKIRTETLSNTGVPQVAATPVTGGNSVTSSANTTGTSNKEDLSLIFGIGPAVETLLNQNGIESFAQLHDAGLPKVESILRNGGANFASIDPSNWMTQAAFAKNADWVGLKNWLAANQSGTESVVTNETYRLGVATDSETKILEEIQDISSDALRPLTPTEQVQS